LLPSQQKSAACLMLRAQRRRRKSREQEVKMDCQRISHVDAWRITSPRPKTLGIHVEHRCVLLQN
jgi:hypothetical protein